MTLIKITVVFVIGAIIFLVLLLTECSADCYYGCSDSNPPEDGIAYWLNRDGDYIPVPAPPPAFVWGPPVYYHNGYPVQVSPYPPDQYHHNGHRRRGLSNEAIREHERAVQQQNQPRRW